MKDITSENRRVLHSTQKNKEKKATVTFRKLIAGSASVCMLSTVKRNNGNRDKNEMCLIKKLLDF